MIKKKDNTGKEEITENFVNITESEKDKFMSNSQSQIYTPQMRIDGYDSNLFDKLFKWWSYILMIEITVFIYLQHF